MKYSHEVNKIDKIYIFKELDSISYFDVKRMSLILPEYRLKKLSQYKRVIDQKNCAIAYLLLLLALEKEFNITDQVALAYGSQGKPYLKYYTNIYFNISHCSKAVVCAVAKNDIGIDIERIDNNKFFLSLNTLSFKEMEYIASMNDQEMFFKLWVLKEATVKRTGVGLGYGINCLEFLHINTECFYKNNCIYHLKKIDDMYLAICNKGPVAYRTISKKELMNICNPT